MDSKSTSIVALTMLGMLVYFLLATPVMMDDGFHYQGFTEALARGDLDFHSFYGFQGLSILSVPIFFLTRSPISIIITSIILSLLSIPIAYAIGKHFGSGIAGVMIFLLTPYPYMTMMRGFQEAALLFFILLVFYGALLSRVWTGIAWGFGSIVKPFTFVLLPLFKLRVVPLLIGLVIMGTYGVLNYAQTGHVVNLAATGAYEGVYDPNNVPPLEKSFRLEWKTWARVVVNFLDANRKIMVSPLLIMFGAGSLLIFRSIPLRNRIIFAILLNIAMVGPISYAFPKYLLPATTLLSFAAVFLFAKNPLLWLLVLLDSILVFLPNFNYFGRVFWSSAVVGLLPFFYAIMLWMYETYRYYSNPARA